MPHLKLQTNRTVETEQAKALLSKASRAVAEGLDKPERYVMVSLEQSVPFSFGGDFEPAAYLELKSIGLPLEKTAALATVLCDLIELELGVPPDRTYIEFTNAERRMWGWNRDTF